MWTLQARDGHHVTTTREQRMLHCQEAAGVRTRRRSPGERQARLYGCLFAAPRTYPRSSSR